MDARGRGEEPRREGKERENRENILIQVSEGEDEALWAWGKEGQARTCTMGVVRERGNPWRGGVREALFSIKATRTGVQRGPPAVVYRISCREGTRGKYEAGNRGVVFNRRRARGTGHNAAQFCSVLQEAAGRMEGRARFFPSRVAVAAS